MVGRERRRPVRSSRSVSLPPSVSGAVVRSPDTSIVVFYDSIFIIVGGEWLKYYARLWDMGHVQNLYLLPSINIIKVLISDINN